MTRWILLLAASGVVLGGAVSAVVRRDVLDSARRLSDSEPQLNLRSARLSRTHGLSFEYRVEGLPDHCIAHWRLIPFREVDWTK